MRPERGPSKAGDNSLCCHLLFHLFGTLQFKPEKMAQALPLRTDSKIIAKKLIDGCGTQ